MSKKWKGPDLDKYLENRNKRLVTYVQGAQIYSMNYYTFVRLAREAGANIRSRKVVVAAMYLAAGIRELSRTIIVDEDVDEETKLRLQNELAKLSTNEVSAMIDMLLEEKNQDYLDMATVRLFSEFRKGNIIVGDKVVPISQYIDYSVDNLVKPQVE